MRVIARNIIIAGMVLCYMALIAAVGLVDVVRRITGKESFLKQWTNCWEI